MEVGVVRVAEDGDFDRLKNLVDNHDGWKLEYNKPDIQVFTKATDDKCNFKLIKIIAVLSDVDPVTVYDVLHDPDYRKEWDTHMISSEDIGFLNINNDVGYYAMSCPSPLKNRDFVLQRSWLDTGVERMIINHSVYHKNYPPRKGFVRAISQVTGWLVRGSERGARVSYVSRTDPRGRLPAWLVNAVTKELGPKMAKKLHTAASRYPEWKAKSLRPNSMPWRYPDQIPSERISIADCIDTGQKGSTETIPDESSAKEGKRRKSRRLSDSD